jgi:histidine triad (HIT) family protein
MSDCIFCKIISGDIPAKVVFEDDRVLAFEDIHPQAPTHILLIPKAHYASLNQVPEDQTDLIGHMLMTARRIAGERGIGEEGFRIVLNTGPNSGQDVFHIHFHLLGGRRMTWPPG